MTPFTDRIIQVLKEHQILAAIVGVGFLLRISGIFWGIPFPGTVEGQYHPDEGQIVKGAVGFPEHIWTNLKFNYPTFFHYFLGIMTWPLRLLFDGVSLFESEGWKESFPLVVTVMGRICSVLAGTGTIFLTYLLAKDVFDQRRALLASAFLALTMYHVSNSPFVTTDVLTSFFLVLFLLLLRRAFLTPDIPALFVYSGMILGLLVGTKYTGAIACWAIVVMYVSVMVTRRHISQEGEKFNSQPLHWNLLLCGVVSIVTFFVTTPGILFHFGSFIDSILALDLFLGRYAMPRSDWETWLLVFHKIVVVMGFPLACLFVLGLVLPVKKNVYEMSYLAILGVFFLYFGATLLERYVILVAPLMALLASNCAFWVYESSRKPIQILGLSMMTIVLVYSLGYCVAGAYVRHHDTRTEVGQFVRHTLPKGTSIGLAYISEKYGWTTHPWKYPKIDFNWFTSKDFLDYPEVVIVSSAFHGTHIEEALESEKLSEDYVWDERYNKEWWKFSPPSPRVFRFYDELYDHERSPYILVKTFQENDLIPVEFASPEIKIFIHQSFEPKMVGNPYFPRMVIHEVDRLQRHALLQESQ